MKTKELMIGDWVSVKSCSKQNFCKISKLDPNMESSVYPIHVERPAEGLSYTFLDEDEIEPIPLTAEILEKNGFLGNDYGEIIIGEWRIMCDCLNVAILHNEHVCIDIPIRFVHELQQALRFCKIDKEIEL